MASSASAAGLLASHPPEPTEQEATAALATAASAGGVKHADKKNWTTPSDTEAFLLTPLGAAAYVPPALRDCSWRLTSPLQLPLPVAAPPSTTP